MRPSRVCQHAHDDGISTHRERDVRPGEVVDDRFEVERFVARGGGGAIYKARDKQTGKPVALKVIDAVSENSRVRAALEAHALFDLSHPAIVGYVAHGTRVKGPLYLAMEWLEGETLAAHLRTGPMSLSDTLVVVNRVAQGLAAAHARNMVHRDIKPSNIMLVDGDPAATKVLDFGIVRANAAQHITWTGAQIGTPMYMSPEQARGESATTPAADVFALGAVLYRCLVGESPFIAARPEVSLAALAMLETAPRLLHAVPAAPAELDGLLAKMMAPNPAHRLPDGAAVVTALASLRLPVDVDLSDAARLETALTNRERRTVAFVVVEAPAEPPLDTSTVDASPEATLQSAAAAALANSATRTRTSGHPV